MEKYGNPEERDKKQILAVKVRKVLSKRFRVKFEDAGKKIVRSEIREIRKAINKYLTQRDVTQFETWLRAFYQEHQSFIDKTIAPYISSYAEEIRKAAAMEVNGDGEMSEEFSGFVRAYISTFVLQHAGSSQGQIMALLEEAAREGTDPGELVGARLDEWDEKRPGKIAMRETVSGDGAFTIATYVGAGVLYKTWVSVGDSCPYCRGLDGRIIGINEAFLQAGESYQPEGAEAPLVPKGMRKHPPAHEGCDCGVAAAF